LNFALALFLFSTVSMTKLRLTTKYLQTPAKITTVTFRGYITDTTTKDKIPQGFLSGAKITFVKDTNTYYAKIVGDGIYEATLPIGRYMRITTIPGFNPVQTKICIRTSASIDNPKNTINLDEIPQPAPKQKQQIDVAPASTYTVRGVIKDSTTNKPINSTSVTVVFISNATGVKYNATISAGGIYEVSDLPNGKYKIITTLSGYVEEDDFRNITASSTEKDLNNAILLSPDIQGWRMVLTWDKLPLDLDAHVILTDGTTEVNFDNKKSKDGHITLDVDNKQGYGPETVSFLNPNPGVYKYYVQRYSNELPLQQSKAKVVVYNGDKKYKSYHVPTDGDTTLDNWYVFDLDITNNIVNPVNQLFASSS